MAKGRKANGEGTIYKRKDGTYCAQEYIDGRRITGYGKNVTQARKKLKEKIKEAIAEGEVSPPKDRKTTVADYIPHFRQTFRSQKATTLGAYSCYFNRIKNYIGEVPLCQFGQTTLLELNKQLLARYKPITVSRTLDIACILFYRAQEEGYIPKDSKINRRYFVTGTLEAKPLPPPEKVFKAISRLRSRTMRFIGFFALYTGLRRGELAGLKWEDVDLNTGLISINRSITVNVETGEDIITTPKNGKRGEIVQIPDIAKTLLQEVKKYYTQKGVLSEFVFCDKHGHHLRPASITAALTRAMRRVSPYGAVHILRHINATILARNNVPIRTISKQLRHSRVSTTDRYINDIMGESRDEIKSISFPDSSLQ